MESPIRGENSATAASVTDSLSSSPSAEGLIASVEPPTSSSAPQNSNSSTEANIPTVVANPPTPNGVLIAANNPSPDAVRAKFASSPGYVVPAPPFSYSVLPRLNSSVASTQQSSPPPGFKLPPQMPAAALQPPVPGQYLGNKPSFSYNVVAHANSSSSTGQQFHFHTAANQVPQVPRFAAPNNAASLQPPVPGQSSRPGVVFSGSIASNPLASVQLPLPLSKPDLPKPANMSSLQQMPLETSEKKKPSDTGSLDSKSDASSGMAASSQSMLISTSLPPSSVMSEAKPSDSPSISIPTNPSFAPHPATVGLVGTSIPRLPNPAIVLSATKSQPVASVSPPFRPAVPLGAAVPMHHAATSSTSGQVPQHVQQQFYLNYPARPTLLPPPQALFLHSPQSGEVPRSQFQPYSGGLPLSFPTPTPGMPISATPLSTVPPPAVSIVMTPKEQVPGHSGLHQAGNVESPGTGDCLVSSSDRDRQANDLHKEETIKNQDVDAWTAHRAESGALYYYNSVTGESTYEKPASFKVESEKVQTQPTPSSWEKLAGTDWTLVTTNDGKKYYYDNKNKVSCWQLPTEVAELSKNMESDSLKGTTNQTQNASATADKGSVPMSAPAAQTGGRESVPHRNPVALVSSSALDLIKKKLQDAGTPNASSPLQAVGSVTSDLNGSKAADALVKGQQTSNNNDKPKETAGDGNVSDSSSDSDDDGGPTKEECIVQFKEMLKERGVAPFSKWDKELPKIVFDARYKAVPSYSARRAIFEHYVRTRAEEERKEKRAAQKAAVEAFKQLLEEASEDINYKTDYQTFRRKWGSDPRFDALDRKEREGLLNEKVKAAKEKMQALHTAIITDFKAMLQDNTEITLNSRWSRVKDSFRSDPRFKAVKHDEREILFNAYISELKSAEDEAAKSAKAKVDEQEKLREREREMRKRKEREEQEMERAKIKIRRKEAVASYQALLVEMIKDPKASWTESKPKLEKDPQGRATNPDLGQGDAEKLFRDHVKDLYERCVRDFRALLSEIITMEAATRTAEDGKTAVSSWSEAKLLLKSDPRYSKMPSKDRESIWRRHADDMMRKLKQASHTREKPDTETRHRPSTDLSRKR